MSDLGDLSGFLREGNVADLDWLEVDAKSYRELDNLPKQNLDIAPDLQAVWEHEDKPSTAYLVPNQDKVDTMGDLSQVHGPIKDAPEGLLKTARLVIMQTTDPVYIRDFLASRYDSETIKGAKTALASIFAERGLLGSYYISADDFPGCQKDSKKAADFVRKYASGALFVQAGSKCADCIHHRITADGKQHCGVFHKQIEVTIPYSEEIAKKIEEVREVQASSKLPKDRIRTAFLTTKKADSTFTGLPQEAPVIADVDVQEQLISVANLTRQKVAESQEVINSEKARPVVALLKREMLKGHSEAELVRSLKLAFDVDTLKETKGYWGPVIKEAGLYGSVYSTQDSFEDCHEGTNYLSKHHSKVHAIVAGDKCESCIFSKVGRCMMYGRKLVASADEVLSPETVNKVIDEHRIAGLLSVDDLHLEGAPRQILQDIYRIASTKNSLGTTGRGAIEKAFRGSIREGSTNDLVKRDIIKTARRYLNEGLYGSELLAALKCRFASKDLTSTAKELREVLAEQGLQGIKYVDPSVYDDYGRGCQEASRLHRTRGAVKYAKIGDKCGSCIHHTRPGFCSVLNKQLVVEPPYIDKAVEQKSILASGSTMVVPYDSLVNNGLTIMQEMDLQHREASIELNPEPSKEEVFVQFGSQGIKI